ncbi:MAG TPA: hypothetical protein VLX61_04375 [Anaerolineales bacterium]|nr:hypothetical protein [Anaerolineales bacterium]
MSVRYVGEPDAAMSCPSGSEGAGRKRTLARGQRAALPPYATLLLNSGAPVLAVQTILGHKQVDTTLEYARLYDGTVAADYYSAMNHVERQLALPEDKMAEPLGIGQLIALTDALRRDALSPVQAEIVRTLRDGLSRLAEKQMAVV